MGGYIPHSPAEREHMLSECGVRSFRELYKSVPDSVYLEHDLRLDEPESELELRRDMTSLSQKSKVYPVILRGAGAYDHYIPSQVKYITSKEEFVTAYTPYQAEISQGLLQSIFEYQSMICTLTGMDVSNASVYDGASAAAESIAMCRERKRTVAVVSEGMNPDYIACIKTYCFASDTKVVTVPLKDGVTDREALKNALAEDSACFIAAQPNFYGMIEDCEALSSITHECGARFIMCVNPIASALLKSAGECGADIAVGEGQPFGMPLAYGGPYLGFMAAKATLMRRLPGRIVGETVDSRGARAYVLTLQAREQHIRREKASSNICSNEALCALTASVYMSVMGSCGMREAASQSLSKAHYFAQRLCTIPGISLRYGDKFFHEFMTDIPCPAQKLSNALANIGILSGLPYEDGMLWCVTEKVSKEDLDRAVEAIREVCA